MGVLKKKEKTGTVSLSNPDDDYNNAVVVPITFLKEFSEEMIPSILFYAKQYQLKRFPLPNVRFLKS